MKKILSILLILSNFSNLVMGAYIPNDKYLGSDLVNDASLKIWDLGKTDLPGKAKLAKLEDPEYLNEQLEKAKTEKEEGRVIETLSPNNKYMASADILSDEFTIKDTNHKLNFNITEKVGFSISDILWQSSSLMISGFDIKDEKAIMQRFKRYSSEDLEKLGIADAE